jgi:hypothetical protein
MLQARPQDPIFVPNAMAMARSQMSAFVRYCERETGRGCGDYSGQSGAERAHLVVKRRKMGRFPVADLLYCSAPSLVARDLERVKPGLFGALRPLGLVIRRPMLFRSSLLQAHELDKLYSELILLPV